MQVCDNRGLEPKTCYSYGVNFFAFGTRLRLEIGLKYFVAIKFLAVCFWVCFVIV